MLTDGSAFTVTFTVAVFEQLLALVPVTVYAVDVVGATINGLLDDPVFQE